MILVFSDFQATGPYRGAMQAAILRHAGPEAVVVDLMVDAPDRDPMKAAYLLASCRGEFTHGDVGLCVVDPGVGSDRRGLMAHCDGVWLVGPDNGLFELWLRRAKDVRLWQIDWEPEGVSASFHGRDIFGPVAGMIAAGKDVACHEIDVSARFADAINWPDDLAQVIYIDGYGNVMTGLRAAVVAPGQTLLKAGDMPISRARTFSDVRPGEAFWYENAFGLVEIAVNGGRADALPHIETGAVIEWAGSV
jgi:S-adenosylmethionine hydrolase